jgi:hypothetical protein
MELLKEKIFPNKSRKRQRPEETAIRATDAKLSSALSHFAARIPPGANASGS